MVPPCPFNAPTHRLFPPLQRTSCCPTPPSERGTIPREEERGWSDTERWRKKGRQDGRRERMGATRRWGSEVETACGEMFCVQSPFAIATSVTQHTFIAQCGLRGPLPNTTHPQIFHGL
ncbi:Hypothetical predicted protein [Xyrichtys novacula]|uniref:Uncharacterized protein n=1 Tax=Xyrichtys novacula TaxID=13765 RepID=A0AAV1F351_XYRNO|nr:Hypothetical predicted protein [Xyrichtys novacula]